MLLLSPAFHYRYNAIVADRWKQQSILSFLFPLFSLFPSLSFPLSTLSLSVSRYERDFSEIGTSNRKRIETRGGIDKRLRRHSFRLVNIRTIVRRSFLIFNAIETYSASRSSSCDELSSCLFQLECAVRGEKEIYASYIFIFIHLISNLLVLGNKGKRIKSRNNNYYDGRPL